MIKYLFLVRHAQAELPSAYLKDFDRELNSTGVIEASRMGKRMLTNPVKPKIIFASSANRTMTTAQILSEQLGYEVDSIIAEPSLYDASMRNLITVIGYIEEKYDSAMIIGHNPTISYLAEYLTNAEIGSFPTCGVVNIQFENQRWAEISGKTGKLLWFDYPNRDNPDNNIS